ncbi:MAG: NUDIX hydrolase [Parcubacteria group bacterium Gr01-1014_38]|nr:MAG: NUDIX hydrolase [Parcubacteria group bacterium Gr01-1014_38]
MFIVSMGNNALVECTTLYGDRKLVKASALTFRPAAYALVLREGKLLLVNTRSTGKWFFPGGAIERGETMRDGILREVREETGVEIEVRELFQCKESFFYYDPWDAAYHSFSFFYTAVPKTFELTEAYNAEDKEAKSPAWVDVKQLKASDFQLLAGEIFEAFIRTT